MGYRDRIRQHIRRLREEDLPALRDFLRREYRPGAIHGDERHHRWLFNGNPDNNGEGPQYWIYQKDGVIHGQQAGIPFALFVDGQARRASWAINLKVSPAYQMRGVGAVLNDVYVRSNHVTAAINLTDAARSAFLRSGWRSLGTVPKYVRPLSPAGIRAGLPDALQGFAPALYPFLVALEGAWRGYARLRRFRFEPVAAFDSRIDRIWEDVSAVFPVMGRRDHVRLRWRFDEAPDPGRYHRFYLYRGSRLTGYTVLRFGERNGRRVAVVVDLLCPPSQLRILFAFCLREARHAGADDLQTVICPCPKRTGSLLWLGFLQRDSSEYRFMVHEGEEDAATRSLLGDRDNWFVTMADCDLEWMFLREEVRPEQQTGGRESGGQESSGEAATAPPLHAP